MNNIVRRGSKFLQAEIKSNQNEFFYCSVLFCCLRSFVNSTSTTYLPQCSKCQSMISANELVMRADEKYIYHIDCFTCCLCNVLLKPGDDYGLHGSFLFCRLHSEQTTNTTFSLCSPMKSSTTSSSSSTSTNLSTTMKKSRQNSNGTTSTPRKQRTKLNNLENNTNNLEMTGKYKYDESNKKKTHVFDVFLHEKKRFSQWNRFIVK